MINTKEQVDEHIKGLEERSKKNTVDGYVASLKCFFFMLSDSYRRAKLTNPEYRK